MEPFFLVCVKCHTARPWRHRDNKDDCPNGCTAHYTIPWAGGFGPDGAPVPRHDSHKFGDGERWPTRIVPERADNISEMRKLCR